VDDDTMIGIVRERLLRPDTRRGFILDGFPRTVTQARALDDIVLERENGPLVVIDVVVPMQELLRRLVGRRICSKCGTNADPFDTAETCRRCGGLLVHRSDDTQDVVQERLRVYETQTYPLVEYYRDRPTFRVVDGAQPPDYVASELKRAIDEAAGVGEASVRKTRGAVQG
jgi:adenylate kinase